MSGSGPLRELNRSRMAEAALKNEYLTRVRVEKLEREVSDLYHLSKDCFQEHQGVLGRSSFWGRLRWLLTGR